MTTNNEFVILDKKTVTKLRRYLKDSVKVDSNPSETLIRRAESLYDDLDFKDLKSLPKHTYILKVINYFYEEGYGRELQYAILFTPTDVFNFIQAKAEEIIKNNKGLGHFIVQPFSTYSQEAFNVDTVTGKIYDRNRDRIIKRLDKNESYKEIDFYKIEYENKLISIKMQRVPFCI